MTDLKTKALTVANQMAGRNYAMLVAEKISLSKSEQEVIALFVQRLADDILIFNGDLSDEHIAKLELFFKRLCKKFKPENEKLVGEICRQAVAESFLALIEFNFSEKKKE